MAKNIKIVKRDGEKVPFNVVKIKKAIEWAIEGLDINPLVLESQSQINIQDNMTTEQVQETLINTALSLTQPQNLEDLQWRIVAARLLLLNLYKGAKRTRGYKKFGYGSYYIFLKKAVRYGLYDKNILNEYTEVELREMGSERKMEYDRDYDYAGMNLMKTRYLMKHKGKVFELPQDMYLSIALLIALPEKKKNRLKVAKDIYHAIASRKISLATPIVLNLRRPNGNLASCFITAMDDSLDSIYYTLDQLGQISKNAGGVGVNVSRVRSHGAYIKKIKGASGGVLPWIKLINDTAVAVNQLGSRSGAITVAIDVWHRDVEAFLDVQTENGDQRKKSFDVFPQIVVTDEFMRRVENGEEWTLVDPKEVRDRYKVEIAELYGDDFVEIYKKIESENKLELSKKISARDLFKTFLKVAVETGLPYVYFKDAANFANPNKHCGMIGNANLCTESFSNFRPSRISAKYLSKNRQTVTQDIDCGEVHTCNLVSLNLAEMNSDDDLDLYTRLSVRILDNAIDMTKAPIPESDKHNQEYRILGVGSLGLADWLAKRGHAYHGSAAEVDVLFEKIAIAGIDASIDLAKERGVYFNYKGSDWSKGKFFGHEKGWFEENSSMPKRWKELRSKVKDHGIRNGGIFAIAPNTSSSLLMGASASILPIYKKFFVDKASNGAVPICPPFLNNDTFWTYIENQNIDQKHVVDVVSKIQKWTDQGISMEVILNLKSGMKAKDIYDLYMSAWKKGCKTVYYARSIVVGAEDAKTKEECISCAN